MNKSHPKASTLQIALTFLLIIIIGLSIVGFYFAQDWLRTSAINSQSKSPLSLSTNKAGLISSNDFQNNIKMDLDKYAQNTNIIILNYSLAVAPISNPQPIVGISSKYLEVTLKNPVSYKNLLKFIIAIETNIPKMNLKGINIKSIPDSTDSVTVDPLIIEVFVRQ